MTQTAVETYVSEAREQGLTDEVIRTELEKNGWSAAIIDAGLASAQPQSDKEYFAAVLLSAFVGIFGIDRFYLGRYITGILKLITIGGLGIWYLVDLFLIAFGKVTDSKGRQLRHYHRDEHIVKIALLIIIISNLVWGIPYALIGVFSNDFDERPYHHQNDNYNRWDDDFETT